MNSSQSIPMTVYKNVKGYIGKLTIPPQIIPTDYFDNDLTTIVLLDKSGSMGSNTSRLVKKIIPSVFEKLNYLNEVITIIAFASNSTVYQGTINELRKKEVPCGTETKMVSAIIRLKDILLSPFASSKFRILAISDGLLDDQSETLECVNKLIDAMKYKSVLINSQVVRFYTSKNEPDIRGLSSIMRLNTMTCSNVININEFDDNANIIEHMADLFKNDCLSSSICLKAKEAILMEEPWSWPKNQLYFPIGESIVYLNRIDIELSIVIPDRSTDVELKVEIQLNEDVSLSNYSLILGNKLSFYLQKLKVLKIINTQESIDEMNRIVEYFTNYESVLATQDSFALSMNTKISSRVELIKNLARKRKSGLSNLMQSISNDDKINQLNEKQQVDFLREIKTNNRTAKGLAKRALIEGIDFNQITREEVIEMAKHLDELKDVDDSSHSISFYSTCTTMDGIKEVCNLTKDKSTFEDIEAIDIIKLLNIVGIACKGPIGDYPDPMTYRLEDIYPGTFISLSDILIASEISKDKTLHRIGTQQEITNAIPIFEDEKIHQFLLNYAPKLLEYTAGIGMRRVIANIPFTYEYTLLSGIWKMIQLLLKEKTEINIITFTSVLKAYPLASKDHFSYVLDLIQNQNEKDANGRSIYLANNGITNMTQPILTLIQQNNTSQMERILRALYQYEIYQFIRKQIKKATNPNDYINSTLEELLNIDYSNHSTKLPSLFEANTNPVFYSEYEINETKLNEIINQIYWSDFITIVPQFYKAALSSDPIQVFREQTEMNNDFIKAAFGLEYELKLFKLFCIIQAFIFKDQSSRSDNKRKEMKIIDLISYDKANQMVKEYVERCYRNKYNEEYQKQIKRQLEVLTKELIHLLLNANSIEDYVALLSKGTTRGIVTCKIYDVSSLGFNDLKKGLLDMNINVLLRAEKLKVFLLGRDENNNAVWNNGNLLREQFSIYDPILKSLNRDIHKEIGQAYKENSLHEYRSFGSNRQGHSNDKLSYWAKGYATIEEMFQFNNEKEIFEYKKIHFNCCGFGPVKERYKIQKRIAKKMQYKMNVKQCTTDKLNTPKKK